MKKLLTHYCVMPMEHRYLTKKNPVIGMREKVFNLRTTEEKFLIITSFYSVVYIMERSDGTQTTCAPSV